MCKKKSTFVKFRILEPTKHTILSASFLGPHQTFSYIIGLNVGPGIRVITSGQPQRGAGLETLRHETETRSRKSVRELLSREPSPRKREVSRKLR